MIERAGSVIGFPPRLLILILLCLAPSVLFAEGPALPDGADASPQSSSSFHLLPPGGLEAIFAGGLSPEAPWLNTTAHNESEKIILWDEGPASAKSASVEACTDK
jgi:hypothetical protein